MDCVGHPDDDEKDIEAVLKQHYPDYKPRFVEPRKPGMSEQKPILQLCAELPGSEAELRERHDEFNRLFTEIFRTQKRSWLFPLGMSPEFDEISAAKAATDAMIARGFKFELVYLNDRWTAEHYKLRGQWDVIEAEVTASTEQLARAAAALLAAEGMQ